ncbi:hypothetical protein OB966_22320 [Bacillus cereus]|nr:hypothetical protein [Bacillus cereus]
MFKGKGERFSNHKVMIVRDEVVFVERVRCADSDVIETETAIYKSEDAIRYYNETDGAFLYLFNMDIPAKVEAENLKNLRRSMTLKNLFSYNTEKPFDLFKLMPWIFALGVLIFK